MVCACLTLNHLSAWHASFSGARISGSTPRFLMAPAGGPGVESKYCLGRISEMGGKRGPAHVTLQRTTGFPADVHYHSHMAFEYLGSFRAHAIVQLSGEYGREGKDQTHTRTHTCVSHFLYIARAVWLGGWCTEFLQPRRLMSVPKIPVSQQVCSSSQPWLNSTNEICGLDELC